MTNRVVVAFSASYPYFPPRHRQLRHRRRYHTRSSRLPSSSSSSDDDDATTTTNTELEWKRFDYSDNPKWDRRFDADSLVTATTAEELIAVQTEEAVRDKEASDQLKQTQTAWEQLSPDTVAKATATLLPFVQPERLNKIRSVLNQRTNNVRFLFENPANPSNVWACLRTMDSFGVQHVDVILQADKYTQGKAALSQKRGMRTAMGSAKWLTIQSHSSTKEAIETLRRVHDCRIYATDVNENAVDIRNMDWTRTRDDSSDSSDTDNNTDRQRMQPICIVMGNENDGISGEMRNAVDGTFYLPMCGFAESFNLSVATAITLAHLNAASGHGNDDDDEGPIKPGNLSTAEYDCLFLKGLMNSLPQKRMIHALFRKEGIVLPPEIVKQL